MSLNVYRPDRSIATRELLFVGFEGDFNANIRNFPYRSEAYDYTIFDNAFSAFRWLEARVERIETFQPPYAIFCQLDWLMDNHYQFASQLAIHPDLCFVPLVALTEKGKPANKTALAENGVDDCYTVPVEWGMLEKRLDFLNQFKSKILEGVSQAQREAFKLKIPLNKRIFDVVGASLGILFSAWIWLPIALAIWLESKGPVIYRSKRVGFGYQVFDFFKFRSMYADADRRLHEFNHLNQYGPSENNAPVFVKIVRDPRVTRVGRFIRKYSIDELPQFINVLRGDMSLVGNRPLPLYEAETLTRDEWCTRFLAPAGITGLWQVTKRGQADMTTEARIALDIAYAQNYSVRADLEIALKTFTAFIQKEDV
jgi:lipopolysaccharide/colanic/teichoic acid biosynthesis glycosyltransferase